jgi:hypothetical protein
MVGSFRASRRYGGGDVLSLRDELENFPSASYAAYL